MKVLMVIDTKGWVFESHALEIKKRIKEHCFDIVRINADVKSMSNSYDVVYLLDPFLLRHGYPDPEKCIIGLRCDYLFEDYPYGVEGLYFNGIDGICSKIHKRCKVFHVINKYQYDKFNGIVDEKLLLVRNGVDEKLFRNISAEKEKFVVGTAGRPLINKGFYLIDAACKKMGVEFKPAMYGKEQIPRDKMPDYYNSISVYVCMSRNEGWSNGVMEAGFMGVPVISTNCGSARDLIINGEDGIIIDRDISSLCEAIEMLKDRKIRDRLSGSFYRKIYPEYSWDVRIKDFKDMFNLFDKDL